MTLPVFPSLPGVQIGIKKSTEWATIVQKSTSLRETRTALATTPMYNFELPYSYLRTPFAYSELQTLLGFTNIVKGSFGAFLYNDLTDNEMLNVNIGVGDGTTTSFQLERNYGGFIENVENPNVSTITADPLMWAKDGTTQMWPFWQGTLMWLGGSELGPFTISNPGGVITFTNPPGAGVQIYVSGFFYYRCRFANDVNEFKQESIYYYSHEGLDFRGCLDQKI